MADLIDMLFEESVQKGMEKGMQEGMEKGMEKGKIETAKNALKEGLGIDFIAKITGLDIFKIQQLQEEA